MAINAPLREDPMRLDNMDKNERKKYGLPFTAERKAKGQTDLWSFGRTIQEILFSG